VTYTAIAISAVIGCILMDLAVFRTRLLGRKAFWTSYAILVSFQLIVNGFLAGIPIVRYDPDTIIGLRLVYAPVEDLLFGFCVILVTLSTWVWLGRRSPSSASSSRPCTHQAPAADEGSST
jgi:lycopene cyclase domain-containing protein